MIKRLLLLLIIGGPAMALPAGFVYLEDVDASIIQDMKYYTDDNFLGRPVKGYESPVCIITQPAAQALHSIQSKLKSEQLSLQVFDCYRPQMAVDDFIAWSKDESDQRMKAQFYPNINKADFFKLGYTVEQSGHTRGSTVDLTIVDLKTGEPLDMGTGFDFMDPLSHPASKHISDTAHANRMKLRELMLTHGFTPIVTEWWHFTLEDEPYPDTYFNFPVYGNKT